MCLSYKWCQFSLEYYLSLSKKMGNYRIDHHLKACVKYGFVGNEVMKCRPGIRHKMGLMLMNKNLLKKSSSQLLAMILRQEAVKGIHHRRCVWKSLRLCCS